jgi:hypothetical protein
LGGIHVRFFDGNNAFDSHVSNSSADAAQYVIAAIRKAEISAGDQLFIYSELGIYPKSGFFNQHCPD